MIAIFKRNEDMYRKLEFLAATLTYMSKGKATVEVENVYLDYGAGLMWTTLVCHKANRYDDSYQMLYPNIMDAIDGVGDVDSLVVIAYKIFNDQKGLILR